MNEKDGNKPVTMKVFTDMANTVNRLDAEIRAAKYVIEALLASHSDPASAMEVVEQQAALYLSRLVPSAAPLDRQITAVCAARDRALALLKARLSVL